MQDSPKVVTKNMEAGKLRFIVVGSQVVGKTSLINKIMGKTQDPEPTICTERSIFPIDTRLSLLLTDCSSDRATESLISGYGAIADAVIGVYDVSRKTSFGEELLYYIRQARMYNANIPVMIIGSKIDSRNIRDCLKREDGENLALDNNFLFYECSAVETSKEELVAEIIEKLREQVFKQNPNRLRNLYTLTSPSMGVVTNEEE